MATWAGAATCAAALQGCCSHSEDMASGSARPTSGNTAAGTPRVNDSVDIRRPTKPLVIEESDLVKVDGAWLYVLNQHTGLNVVDIAAPRAPELTDRLETLAGQGAELYVRQQSLLVLVEESGLDCHGLAPPELAGYPSTAIATVKDPTLAPEVVADRCVPGSLVTSRLVGDILYVVTTAAPVDPNRGWVFSLDAATAEGLEVIEDLSLSGSGFEVHVTDSAIYLAEDRSSSTSVRYIDIASADGSLVERGSAILTGTPAGRFHMDAYAETFRIVTRDRALDANHLHVLDVSNPGRLVRLASLDSLAPGEELFATRFVEDRAYVVTYQPEVVVNQVTQVVGSDPLWVISLEDPTAPEVLGKLEIPGWSDYIFPRGELLLAVGRGDAGSQVAASLFDVSDPAAPAELRRLQFGSATASSEASSDFRAVQVVEEEFGAPPLVVVPYSDNIGTATSCVPEHHIQLLEIADGDLELRGNLEQSGRVLRTFPVEGQLYSVSTKTVAANDVSDRDEPYTSGEVTVGDPAVSDECVLPPEAPQRVVTMTETTTRSGGWTDDQAGIQSRDGFCACSVGPSAKPCVGHQAWWLLLASALAGLWRTLPRRQRGGR